MIPSELSNLWIECCLCYKNTDISNNSHHNACEYHQCLNRPGFSDRLYDQYLRLSNIIGDGVVPLVKKYNADSNNIDFKDIVKLLENAIKSVRIKDNKSIVLRWILQDHDKGHNNCLEKLSYVQCLSRIGRIIIRDKWHVIESEQEPLIIKTFVDDKSGSNVTLTKELLPIESVDTEVVDKSMDVYSSDSFFPFGRSENEITEFKTSWIYAPVNSRYAQRKNIMIAICSFLNHEGGIVHIGVNDSGNVVGIEEDLKMYFGATDSYKREIQDTIILDRFFKEEYRNIRVEIVSVSGKNVANIIVEPLSKGIAKVDDIAYERWGNECRPMNEREIQERLEQLRTNEQNFSKISETQKLNVRLLKQAIIEKKSVILKSYRSGNSRTVRDRHIEAFKMFPDCSAIMAYDLEEKDEVRRNKQFAINRIESVEVTNTTWNFEESHRNTNVDIFRMTNSSVSESFRVVILLSVYAYNLLVEEHPMSRLYLRQKDESHWVLDTQVSNEKGVGRFCLGLLDDIEIIEGDRLKAYMAGFLKRNFERFCE